MTIGRQPLSAASCRTDLAYTTRLAMCLSGAPTGSAWLNTGGVSAERLTHQGRLWGMTVSGEGVVFDSFRDSHAHHVVVTALLRFADPIQDSELSEIRKVRSGPLLPLLPPVVRRLVHRLQRHAQFRRIPTHGILRPTELHASHAGRRIPLRQLLELRLVSSAPLLPLPSSQTPIVCVHLGTPPSAARYLTRSGVP